MLKMSENPKKFRKPVGAEKRLVCVTYSTIASWVGLTKSTVVQYAHAGHFDSSDLESIIGWVNGRRAKLGLPLLGDDSSAEASVSGSVGVAPERRIPESGLPVVSGGGYDPLTGSFSG
tara:strand:- start:356 stop:709 length:354 start_codon:yes stop_codon:yes gene_type:complete